MTGAASSSGAKPSGQGRSGSVPSVTPQSSGPALRGETPTMENANGRPERRAHGSVGNSSQAMGATRTQSGVSAPAAAAAGGGSRPPSQPASPSHSNHGGIKQAQSVTISEDPRRGGQSPTNKSASGDVKKCMSLQLDVNWEMENTLCISSEGQDDEGGNPLLVPCTPPVGGQGRYNSSMLPCGERVQSKRPVREVFDTVTVMLDLFKSTKKQQTRYQQLTQCLVEETCPIPELSIFYSYLQALLGKIFDPIASSAENADADAVDEECPITTMLTEQVVKDVIDAARASLHSYHRNSRRKLGFSPAKLLGKSLTGLNMNHVNQANDMHVANQSLSHTLSCRSMPRHNMKGDKLNLGAAFAGEAVAPLSPHGNKRRPESRIDRKGTVQNAVLPEYNQESPGRDGHQLSGDSSMLHQSMANLRRHQSISHCASVRNMARRQSSHSTTNIPRVQSQAMTDLSHRRVNSGLSQTHVIPAHITTAQYFDIIIETICVVLCIKYEHQLMELTTEGESSGIRRAAEWVAARILDELYNDGIDPEQALCTQLILCAEGLALEENQYVWRLCSSVDIDVMYVVWGEPPPDVLSGKLEAKDPAETWYEWGVFAQPGIRTPEGRLYSSPRLNPLQYRYRLAPASIAVSLGLDDTRETPLRAPSFLHKRPGQKLTCEATGEHFEGITLSAPPEGSEHKGGTVPRPHIRPKNMSARNALEEKYRQKYGVSEEEYCDADVYEWGFEEAMREQQRQQTSNASYRQMQGDRVACCPKCVIS